MLNVRTWTLSRRVRALSAIVATILGLIALAAVVTAAVNRSDHRHVTNQLTPLAINKERLYQGLLRQQSSTRTFLLTGREEDLRAYNEAVATERQLFADTRRMLATEPALRPAVDQIETGIRAWREGIAAPLIATVRAHGPNPALATPTEQSRAVFTGATGAIDHFGAQVNQRRDRLLHRAHLTGNLLIALLGSAAVTMAVAGVALATLLRRMVTRPVSELAIEVRRVARGDYDHQISASGSPELAKLARDVDAMRRQIAHDLSEVRSARLDAENAYHRLEDANLQLAEANRRLEEQAEELTRSNRDLEQFAYVASHDLQEPLRKVASFCQLLQRRYAGQLDERADQYIGFAVDGAQRMQRLINDLLAFSRIGRLTAGFTDVDLDKVASDAVSQLDAKREEAQAEITWSDLPVVRGEEPLLLALVANLLSNSMKFRRPGVPSRIHLSCERVGDEYVISCRDNGIGIAPEFTDKVFVIFQRLHAKESYPGTGIGLAIVKKIMEYHGGRVWVDREYRDGTLIKFVLPVPGDAS